MKKKIIAGNWKMNHTFSEATLLLDQLSRISYLNKKCEVIIAPPYPYLELAKKITQSNGIKIAAQDCSENQQGAYTGEVSAKIIKSMGAEYVIIGHSERRIYHHENSQQLINKIYQALSNELKIIFCIGESLIERNEEKHFFVIEQQLRESILELSMESMQHILIAYEPVWAIGTGVTASTTQAQEMHEFIRNLLVKKVGMEAAMQMHLLYGGSCNPSNASELFSCKDIDGGLIGGASLKADDFNKIIASV